MPVILSKSISRGIRASPLKYSAARDNRRARPTKIKIPTPENKPLLRPPDATASGPGGLSSSAAARNVARVVSSMNASRSANNPVPRQGAAQNTQTAGAEMQIQTEGAAEDRGNWYDVETTDYKASDDSSPPTSTEQIDKLLRTLIAPVPVAKQPQRSRAGESRLLAEKALRRMEEVVHSLGKIWARGAMSCSCVNTTEVEVLCIDYMECEKKRFSKCKCASWFGRLILRGYFPTTPLHPQTAISIKFLHYLYYTSTRGSFSKEGFASGLQDFHRHFLLPMEKPNYVESFRTCIPFFHRTMRCRDDYVRLSLAAKSRKLYEEKQRDRRAQQADDAMDLDDVTGHTPETTNSAPTTPQVLIPRPLTFQIGSFSELCPCCFYRPYPDDKSSVVVCLDGNFQHRRFRHVASAHAQFRYDTRLFIDPHDSMVATANFVPPKEETLCASNFRATAAKPNSMRPYDETGLLAMVCRHDVPLRYMNLHAGERLLWVTDFIEKMIKEIRLEEIVPERLILMYDIACQLDSFMRHKDHGNVSLASKIEVVVNKFHGYAHDFKCHERWGADQKKDVGLSDGEGVERLWSFLRVLVIAGKSSSPANRKLFLELFALCFAHRKRVEIGKTLIARFRKAQLLRSSAQNILAGLYGRPALLDDSENAEANSDSPAGADNTESNPLITTELLQQERAKRAAYFSGMTVLAAHDYVKVYEAIVAEKELEKKIETIDENLDMGVITDDEHTAQLDELEDIERLREETDKLLAKYKQTREDWAEDGELWKRAVQRRTPDQKVYDRLLLERKAEAELRAAEASTPGPAKRQKVAKARAKLGRQRVASDKMLRERGVTRDTWDPDGSLFERFHLQDVTRKLEHIYRRILQNASARALQLRELKGRTSGHKNSAKLVREIQKSYPGINADIQAFNKQAEEIKDVRLRPPELSLAAFVAHEDDDDKGENARESLFALHLLRTATLEGLESRLHEVTQALWARSAMVRLGIRQLSKLERALEEIEMIKKEWNRITLYMQQFLEAVVAYLQDDQASCKRDVAQMLWDELPVAEGLLRSSGKLAEEFTYLTGVLVCPPEWKQLLPKYKKGIRAALLGVTAFDTGTGRTENQREPDGTPPAGGGQAPSARGQEDQQQMAAATQRPNDSASTAEDTRQSPTHGGTIAPRQIATNRPMPSPSFGPAPCPGLTPGNSETTPHAGSPVPNVTPLSLAEGQDTREEEGEATMDLEDDVFREMLNNDSCGGFSQEEELVDELEKLRMNETKEDEED